MRTAMPSPAGRHQSDMLCAPLTDPTGFIYPTYRAAPTETQRDKPSLKSSHQGVAYVSSAVGAQYPHSPSRRLLQRISSVLLSATVEA